MSAPELQTEEDSINAVLGAASSPSPSEMDVENAAAHGVGVHVEVEDDIGVEGASDADADGEPDVDADGEADLDVQAITVEQQDPSNETGPNGSTENGTNGVYLPSAADYSPSGPSAPVPLPDVPPSPVKQEFSTPPVLRPEIPASITVAIRAASGRQSVTPGVEDGPMDRIEQLRQRVKDDPFDAEAHLALVSAAEAAGDVDQIKQAYEGLLGPYAGAATHQISYLSHFLNNAADFPYAESLFARFLRASPSVELWKFYLTYIRRVNPGDAGRETVKKAYEFALGYIGFDKDSGEIWRDYLQFLKEQPTLSTWEEQQKTDVLRRTYQRCVVIPLENIEALWREFNSFENAQNKQTAKRFLEQYSPAYITARSSMKTLRQLLDPITRPLANGLPLRPTWTEQDKKYAMDWKAYLMWEESNPLDLDDTAALATRVQAAYRKAVGWARFYPEVWYMAYNYLVSNSKIEEGAVLLRSGCEGNPTSFLLHFATAELEEGRKNYPAAHATFNNLITNLTSQVKQLQTSIEAEAELAKGAEIDTSTLANSDSLSEDFRKANEEREERGQRVWARRGREFEDLKAGLQVAWIMLMRFARRAEGLKAARTVFGRARKSEWAGWQVFEASALMEYHCTKASDVAGKIFELGLKSFADNVDFVLRYLGFLISINDDANARALFERFIPTFPADKARPLWERWARYEYNFGDLAATQKLEKRIAEAFPNDPPTKRFAQKYEYLNMNTIRDFDMGFGYRPPAPVQVPPLPPAPTLPPPQPAKRPVSPSPPPAARREPPKRPREPSPDRRGPIKKSRQASPPPRDRIPDRGWQERDNRGYQSPRPRSPPLPSYEDRVPAAPAAPSGAVPALIAALLAKLPSANVFDGPVFRTDDLMQVFRNSVIPGGQMLPAPSGPPRARSPQPARGGRPPPDYGPYRGPNSGPGRRY
ncbi:Suf-domain-containing protein [Dacryopinax primogenitus]|uniref:mRNA 3'-end-processing protein RNA14 n=1 Tax=Dacryopinax primogenitus (strain DJM 731) TaxID=1858805 RepID=M5FTC7_DACPD|nr:Suf-domain-containing protein [Dacryopinax primogenitus]EJU00881.1 Suf-domain-containing protein [Dacryopinax primogenitus]